MARKKSFMRQYEKTIGCSLRLKDELKELGEIASNIMEERLQADICAGDEIEFHRVDGDGNVDPFDIVSLYDVLERQFIKED